MSTATITNPVANVHASRPRLTQRDPSKDHNRATRHTYRPIRLSDADLDNIGKIQRRLLQAQSKPKSAVNFAQAVRAAVEFYAKHLEKK